LGSLDKELQCLCLQFKDLPLQLCLQKKTRFELRSWWTQKPLRTNLIRLLVTMTLGETILLKGCMRLSPLISLYISQVIHLKHESISLIWQIKNQYQIALDSDLLCKYLTQQIQASLPAQLTTNKSVRIPLKYIDGQFPKNKLEVFIKSNFKNTHFRQ